MAAPPPASALRDISIVTIAASVAISIVTGYVGGLLTQDRQRKLERRTYGLSLLAEMKALQTLLRRHQTWLQLAWIEAGVEGEPAPLAPGGAILRPADLLVYMNNSGRIGLFSARTAIGVIEFYAHARILLDEAQFIRERLTGPQARRDLSPAMREHHREVASLLTHGLEVTRLLRREVPATLAEQRRFLRRRLHQLLNGRAIPHPVHDDA